MSIPPAWLWMILAAAFMIAEIFTAGFFLLWFGIGAAVAGVLALLGFGAIWQWGAFVVTSLVLFFGSRRFAERMTQGTVPGVGADRYLGSRGVVLEDIVTATRKGRVRLGSEVWRAESASGDSIPTGSTVTVVGMNGTFLVVNQEKELR